MLGELKAGLDHLHELIQLLPVLKTVVLVGRKAQRAARLFEQHGIRSIPSIHPSPINRASRPEEWARLPIVDSFLATVSRSKRALAARPYGGNRPYELGVADGRQITIVLPRHHHFFAYLRLRTGLDGM